MSARRSNAGMNPVTLCGCSERHQHRIFCHHSEDFLSSGNEDFLPQSATPSTVEGTTHIQAGEEVLRRKLSWFFMNPYQKYKVKGRKPWKLVLQIFKIVLITAQAAWFAMDLQSVVNFDTDNLAAFRHIFIKDYPGGLRFVPLFTKGDLYNRMHYVWLQYHNFTELTVGSYDFAEPLGKRRVQICIYRLIPNRRSDYDEDDSKETCHYLVQPSEIDVSNITEFVVKNRIPRGFEFIAKVVLKFSVKAKNMKHNLDKSQADCYTYNIRASFNNDDYDGKMQFRLFYDKSFKPCESSPTPISYAKLGVEVFVIILCIISLTLCMRSFLRHLKLSRETTQFFKEFRHENLTFSDKLNFLNFWIMLIILSDILVVCGTIIKIAIDFSDVSAYDACALLLGSAVLFSWVGILRYLGFLKGYNTLLITLKVAFPQVCRFLVCAAVIYFGFTFCGWVVFGPYHEKFKDIITTSECLYSLVNGDDMFNTFKLMDNRDYTLWIFSKVYLYLFISLFIFVVLSLFIGIISDTYERIKDYGHAPKTRIQLFMEGLEYHDPDSDESGNDSDIDESERRPLL